MPYTLRYSLLFLEIHWSFFKYEFRPWKQLPVYDLCLRLYGYCGIILSQYKQREELDLWDRLAVKCTSWELWQLRDYTRWYYPPGWAINRVVTYVSDVIISCVGVGVIGYRQCVEVGCHRLSSVSQSTFKCLHPHVWRNCGNFNVDTSVRYMRALVWNPVVILWKLNEYIEDRHTDTTWRIYSSIDGNAPKWHWSVLCRIH
jgi:hypothetical protein